ncbi:MAG TPA: hypothetical protein VF331_24250 [Polyangiales bacterium]
MQNETTKPKGKAHPDDSAAGRKQKVLTLTVADALGAWTRAQHEAAVAQYLLEHVRTAFLGSEVAKPTCLIETGLGAVVRADEAAVWEIEMLLLERAKRARTRAQELFDVAIKADERLTHVLVAARNAASELGDSPVPPNTSKAVPRGAVT